MQFNANKRRKPRVMLSDGEILSLKADRARLERTVIEQATELAQVIRRL